MPDLELRIENLAFTYESESASPIFESIEATIPLRGVSLILGANAVGKTTLARLLCGFDRPAAGVIRWPEAAAAGTLPWNPPRAAVIFEEPEYQLQTFEAGDELNIGLLHCGASKKDRQARVSETALALGLEDWLETPLQTLDRAGKMTVLCAAFVALGPDLLVLDFSPDSLEPSFRERLVAFSRQGGAPALLFLSRQAADLARLAPGERAWLLESGRLARLEISAKDPELIERLRRAGIQLPWYYQISQELVRGAGSGTILYPDDESFNRALRQRPQDHGTASS